MQYILFVVACLAADPTQCTAEKIDLPEITNATGCHLAGQYSLNQWLRDHRELDLREAKCMGRPLFPTESATASNAATGG